MASTLPDSSGSTSSRTRGGTGSGHGSDGGSCLPCCSSTEQSRQNHLPVALILPMACRPAFSIRHTPSLGYGVFGNPPALGIDYVRAVTEFVGDSRAAIGLTLEGARLRIAGREHDGAVVAGAMKNSACLSSSALVVPLPALGSWISRNLPT